MTFGNINGVTQAVKNVTTINTSSLNPTKNSTNVMCIVDEVIFAVPPSYRRVGADVSAHVVPMDEEDILLQLAIQQSLADNPQADGAEEKVASVILPN